VIRRALATSFSRLADALRPSQLPSQAQEEERAALIARVAELEGERDEAAADAALARADVRLLLIRTEELEAEREWRPWPPEVMDGRCLIANHCGSIWLTVARLTTRPVTAYREIPAYVPPKGDAE
jgi:hypothetical protein